MLSFKYYNYETISSISFARFFSASKERIEIEDELTGKKIVEHQPFDIGYELYVIVRKPFLIGEREREREESEE